MSNVQFHGEIYTFLLFSENVFHIWNLQSNKRFVKVGNENKLRFDLRALNLSLKCTYMFNI